ncbi:MAG: cytidylate kinase-like family protein [Oscillospiraceae bacterium]|jgi:cytidylate kinase|nr:cytidylate kinase-like family protein [Oscillospiraceae bacterium]
MNYAITIAREYGAGGKQIGLQLAEELGIAYIERDLLKMASLESGISEELFSLADQRMRLRDRLLGMVSQRERLGAPLTPEHVHFVSDRNIFNIQSKVLKFLAETTSFVVMGKAAHFVLRDMPNVLCLGVQAPFANCVAFVMEYAKLTRREAERAVRETNKYREEYNRFYTGRDWKLAENYDLVFNTGKMTCDQCVQTAKFALKTKLGVEVGV